MYSIEKLFKKLPTVKGNMFLVCSSALRRATFICLLTLKSLNEHVQYHYETDHSRPQSLRSFWPAAGNESSGSNHYERTKEITEFWLSGSLRTCIYGACLKWLLPELSIPAAGQKDRRLWGREWRRISTLLAALWKRIQGITWSKRCLSLSAQW